jgi:hypothetical protein
MLEHSRKTDVPGEEVLCVSRKGGRPMSLNTLQSTQTPTPSREFGGLKVVRRTGWFGLAGVAFFVLEFPLWVLPGVFFGSPPQMSDAVNYSPYMASMRVIALTRILLDMGMYASMMVFFAGLRHLLIYNGSVAFAVTGLFMASAGYAILATGALPKWIGWFAWVSAILCVVAIPSMYSTLVDPNGFYNVAGWGPMLIANFPPLIWLLVTSLAMIRKR